MSAEIRVERRSVVSGLAAAVVSGLSVPALAYTEEYRREPTQDFVESEKKAAEFKAKQKKLKVKFQGFLDDLNAATTDDECATALKEMRMLVVCPHT